MTIHSEPFLERLQTSPILCDGAMGTLLLSRLGAASVHSGNVCFDNLNRTHAELVQSVHLDYIRANAGMIETNTFGANRVKLERYGFADAVRDINRAGVRIAREAREIAGVPVFVAGSVGPTGLPACKSDDVVQRAYIRSVFHDQIEALVEAGVDVVILETFPNVPELIEAIQAAHDVSDIPVIAQMTFTEDGHTLAGQHPAEVVQSLSIARPDVIGVNCGMGPAGTLEIAQAMAQAIAELPSEHRPFLSAQPNAGLSSRVDGRFLYVSTPEYFAEYTHRFLDVGVQLIGGCCGTTPMHVVAMHNALHKTTGIENTHVSIGESTPHVHATDEIAPEAGIPTRWQQALESGRFAISVELDPPKGMNPTKVLAGAEALQKKGVEFINIADSPTARVRMSSIALSRLVQERLGMDPIIHTTTRDRNLMALQSDMLGAHAMGLRNILALTGDPLRIGDYPNLTGVWNIDSIGLVRILRGMNEGHDSGGSPLGGKTSFYIGAALDVNVPDTTIDVDIERARNKIGLDAALMTEQDLEFSRFAQKIASGAQYIMTQFIYDLEPLRAFIQKFGKPSAPIILGLSPLHSYKHAEFLHNEVRGITIPLEIRERMRSAGERSRDVGLEIAYELLSTARDEGLIQGCYLLPSYGRYDLVAELAAALVQKTGV